MYPFQFRHVPTHPPGATVASDAPHLDLDIRSSARETLAVAGRHQPAQRSARSAPVHPRGDAATQRHGAAHRPRQGRRLRTGVGGKALRMDLRTAFQPVASVQQGPLPPLRPGLRSRTRRPGRLPGQLRARMGTAEPDGPDVRCAPGDAGGGERGQARSGSDRLRSRRARRRTPHPVRRPGAQTAVRRARAGHRDDARNRPQPVRKRTRRPARRPRLARHGRRSGPAAAQEPGQAFRRATAPRPKPVSPASRPVCST